MKQSSENIAAHQNLFKQRHQQKKDPRTEQIHRFKLKTGHFYFSQKQRQSEANQIKQNSYQQSVPQSSRMSFDRQAQV